MLLESRAFSLISVSSMEPYYNNGISFKMLLQKEARHGKDLSFVHSAEEEPSYCGHFDALAAIPIRGI